MFRTEIQAGSFNVAALSADETGCDWAYSIGLEHNFNHPELLVVGLEATFAGAVIELLGEEIAAGRHLGAGEVVRLDGGMNYGRVLDTYQLRIRRVSKSLIALFCRPLLCLFP